MMKVSLLPDIERKNTLRASGQVHERVARCHSIIMRNIGGKPPLSLFHWNCSVRLQSVSHRNQS
jgi:hypothetical protein